MKLQDIIFVEGKRFEQTQIIIYDKFDNLEKIGEFKTYEQIEKIDGKLPSYNYKEGTYKSGLVNIGDIVSVRNMPDKYYIIVGIDIISNKYNIKLSHINFDDKNTEFIDVSIEDITEKFDKFDYKEILRNQFGKFAYETKKGGKSHKSRRKSHHRLKRQRLRTRRRHTHRLGQRNR